MKAALVETVPIGKLFESKHLTFVNDCLKDLEHKYTEELCNDHSQRHPGEEMIVANVGVFAVRIIDPRDILYNNILKSIKKESDNGLSDVWKRDFSTGKAAYICKFAIHPNHRGLGYGADMLKMAIGNATKRENISWVFIFVSRDNLRALNLYMTRGFRICGYWTDTKTGQKSDYLLYL